MKTRKYIKNQRDESAAVFAETSIVTTIFTLFTNESFQRVLEGLGHFILFPFAAASTIIRAIITMKQAALDKQKAAIVHALVETLAAVAVVTAVVGGLAFGSIFAMVSPIMFTAIMGAKTLYNAVAASYYFFKLQNSSLTAEVKKEYQAKMTGHLISTLVLGLTTAAVGLVMVAAKPIFAFIGVIASTIGMSYSLYNMVKANRRLKKEKLAQENAVEPVPTVERPLTSSPQVRPAHSPSAVDRTKYGKLFVNGRVASADDQLHVVHAAPPTVL